MTILLDPPSSVSSATEIGLHVRSRRASTATATSTPPGDLADLLEPPLMPAPSAAIAYRKIACSASTFLRISLFVREKIYYILAGVAYICISAAILYHHAAILDCLDRVAALIRSMGAAGFILISALVFVASFPLVPGYGTLTTFCGFVYGFPLGFIPAFIGALSGATTVFSLTRRHGTDTARKYLREYRWATATIRAVNDSSASSLRILVLIRLAPYPFSIMNFALALCSSLTLPRFAMATAISLVKLNTHVLVGAGLDTLQRQIKGSSAGNGLATGEMVVMAIAGTLGMGVAAYVYRMASRLMEDVEEAGSSDELDVEAGESEMIQVGGDDDGEFSMDNGSRSGYVPVQ